MSLQFKAGSWNKEQAGSIIHILCDGSLIVNVDLWSKGKLLSNSISNLIVASPDLLEACKTALALILEFHDEQGTTSPFRRNGNTDFREEINILKSAISKAEGTL